MAECLPDKCLNRGPRGGRCRSCEQKAINRRVAEWRERNRELDLQRNAAAMRERRAADPVHARETGRAQARKWRAAHPEQWRLIRDAASKRWREANLEYARLTHSEVQARRRKAQGRQRVDYSAILDQFGMTCHLCGDPIASRTDLHMDHVIPLARGGAHRADNIRPAHAFCNLSKGTRLLS